MVEALEVCACMHMCVFFGGMGPCLLWGHGFEAYPVTCAYQLATVEALEICMCMHMCAFLKGTDLKHVQSRVHSSKTWLRYYRYVRAYTCVYSSEPWGVVSYGGTDLMNVQ